MGKCVHGGTSGATGRKIIQKSSSVSLAKLFHLGDRTTASSSTQNNLDIDESSIQSDENNKDNDEDGTLLEEHEQETQKIAKQDQTAH
jgi:hypothetical protein